MSGAGLRQIAGHMHDENEIHRRHTTTASRISGLSAPGEVLVSDIVRGLARTSAWVRFEDGGEQSMKGVGSRCGCGLYVGPMIRGDIVRGVR